MKKNYNSRIRCSNREALEVVKKVVLNKSTSKLLKEGKSFMVFETKSDDLEELFKAISKGFPKTTFTCVFSQMTDCGYHSTTKKRIRDGKSVYLYSTPSYLFNRIIGKDLVPQEVYQDFINTSLKYFKRLYKESHYNYNAVLLEPIYSEHKDWKNFKVKTELELDSYLLSATLYNEIIIDIEIRESNKSN